MSAEQREYDSEFFTWQKEGSKQSARIIIPEVMGILNSNSVVDIGCGYGAWLSVFQEYGIHDLQGVDGDYIEDNQLMISTDKFARHDLEHDLDLGRQFDLAVSLEVAEHLTEASSEVFIHSLTRHSATILFSAAIPNQGGKHHVNEQWQSYWAEKFQRRGYLAIDAIRKKIWNHPQVEWWYSQNILIYSKPEIIASNPSLQQEFANTTQSYLNLVHPKNYASAVETCPADLYLQKRYS